MLESDELYVFEKELVMVASGLSWPWKLLMLISSLSLLHSLSGVFERKVSGFEKCHFLISLKQGSVIFVVLFVWLVGWWLVF